MTQEHREQFLATEGWQQTERGHIRGPEFGQIVLTYANFQHVASVPRSRKPQPGRKFRRFPFGRQPKHDALVGWFATDAKIRRGGLRELNEMATRAEAIRKTSGQVEEYQRCIIDFWMKPHPENKRRGWKTIEVGDGEKKEKVVVEVMG